MRTIKQDILVGFIIFLWLMLAAYNDLTKTPKRHVGGVRAESQPSPAQSTGPVHRPNKGWSYSCMVLNTQWPVQRCFRYY